MASSGPDLFRAGVRRAETGGAYTGDCGMECKKRMRRRLWWGIHLLIHLYSIPYNTLDCIDYKLYSEQYNGILKWNEESMGLAKCVGNIIDKDSDRNTIANR